MMTRFTQKAAILACFLCISITCATSQSAAAQGSPVDVITAPTQGESENQADLDMTHPPIRLTPDKSELLRLDKKAGSVIVGNPSHINVLAESAKTLVFVPRAPGATHVTILDQEGEVLMSRHVIVASPKKKYVRIRNSCNRNTENCQPTQVYYCPDMCHEIAMGSEIQTGVASPAAGGSLQNTAQGAAAVAEAIDPEAVQE